MLLILVGTSSSAASPNKDHRAARGFATTNVGVAFVVNKQTTAAQHGEQGASRGFMHSPQGIVATDRHFGDKVILYESPAVETTNTDVSKVEKETSITPRSA
ncbi:MAG: hypothetical protein JW809_15950 [Pirellulales bacterium]|nr:hypothetical protein [Pirellulales bacterium]